MMRSMYSAVSGLKTHQTKMDVIGNNIANVNTVAFKSSSVVFQDVLYQMTSNASGANAATGTGGVNAKQIGLGVTTGATNLSITTSGAAETTGRAFDIRLSDQSTTNFFVVNNGSENLFTRAGSFYVDGAGNLCMTSTGYTVMGWQVDPTTGNIKKDTVSALRVMQTSNLTSAPEATTQANVSGIIDKNDKDVLSDNGLVKTLTFFDNLGYSYTARFAMKSTGTDGKYTVELEKILNSDGTTFYDPETSNVVLSDIFGAKTTNATLGTYSQVQSGYYYDSATKQFYVGSDTNGKKIFWDSATNSFKDRQTPATTHSLKQVYGISNAMVAKITGKKANATVENGTLTITGDVTDYAIDFSTKDGTFSGVGERDTYNADGSVNKAGSKANTVTLNMSKLGNNPTQFDDITIDFSGLKDANNGGKSTAVMSTGSIDDGVTGKGKKLGAMIGISIDNNGLITGTYDNGNKETLGQIAVAQFANASGLEKVGENCYRTTLNSGEFDGIGVEISADGSSMTSGELEMSNVDLSTEFTQMIITQRGFQANSRIITTSDTLLEELVNLKR
ncbi:flagellar hook protein FlgE [Roseburia intestinalis]|uniref:flagellar hook protein FlgE n=1 Tax=Roseburia intestinalis TaxID=166486 RepID=UPI00189EBED3|nr:flagellar hook-basal body complex protein [Roseburia intestinalis]